MQHRILESHEHSANPQQNPSGMSHLITGGSIIEPSSDSPEKLIQTFHNGDPMHTGDCPIVAVMLAEAGSPLPLGTMRSEKPKSIPTTLEKASTTRSNLSNDIFRNFNRLNGILSRHESTIRRRWLKKRLDKRIALLKAVWPDIPDQHRSDWAAYQQAVRRQLPSELKKTKYRESFLMYEVNSKDLTHENNLLSLLNCRGRHMPEVFVKSDLVSMRFGTSVDALSFDDVAGHVMFLDGNCSESYGRIIPHDQLPTEEPQVCKLECYFDVGVGLVIMEKQKILLRFLVDTCEKILHDIASNHLLNDTYPIHKEPELDPSPPDARPNLASLRRLRPYTIPQASDITKTKLLIEARATAAFDHLQSLREDPEYFAASVEEFYEHSPDRLTYWNESMRHELEIKKGRPHSWNGSYQMAAIDAYNTKVCWTMLDHRLEHFVAAAANHPAGLHMGAPISPELQYEYGLLWYCTRKLMLQFRAGLLDILFAAPSFRGAFHRDPRDVAFGERLIRPKPGAFNDSLLYLLSVLALPPYKGVELGPTDEALVELQRLLDNEPHQKSRVTPLLAQRIGDIALASELVQQIQRWLGTQYETPFFVTEKLDEIDASISGDLIPLATAIDTLSRNDLLPTMKGPQEDKAFNYPAHKKRTPSVVDQMRSAETNLDRFWTIIDNAFVDAAGHVDLRWLLGTHQIHVNRTQPWTEPLYKKSPVRPKSQTHFFELGLEKPVHSLALRSKETETTEFKVTPRKEKQKSRGIPGLNFSSTGQAEQPPQIELGGETPPVYALGKRAYKTFTSLFHDSNEHDTPSQLSWDDFINAMAAMDFEIRQMDGSMWKFASKSKHGSVIVIHQPHPANRFTPHAARFLGRRLKRKFGWTSASFVRKN